jgi:mannose-6-phosphate isomerase-like protein (cupin superfamily)
VTAGTRHAPRDLCPAREPRALNPGDDVIDASAESIISVPPDTLRGFRNIGQEPLLIVSVHESPTLVQGFTDRAPV